MTKQLSQTALYGELQTSDQQYRNEVGRLFRLTQEEEHLLVERAKEGDAHVRNQIIESCLHYVEYWASRLYRAYSWQSWRTEYVDLIQVGNVTLLETFDKAMEKEDSIAYLKGAAKLGMLKYVQHHRSSITTPGNEYTDIPVESFDAPLGDENTLTLADVIEDLSYCVHGKKSFDALYQALELLTEKQRETIKRLYGLEDYGSESQVEVASEKVSPAAVCIMKQDAFVKMRVLMPSPDICQSVYTAEQASSMLGTKTHTFYRWTKKYHIQPIFKGFYLRRDIEQIEQAEMMQDLSA